MEVRGRRYVKSEEEMRRFMEGYREAFEEAVNEVESLIEAGGIRVIVDEDGRKGVYERLWKGSSIFSVYIDPNILYMFEELTKKVSDLMRLRDNEEERRKVYAHMLLLGSLYLFSSLPGEKKERLYNEMRRLAEKTKIFESAEAGLAFTEQVFGINGRYSIEFRKKCEEEGIVKKGRSSLYA